MSPRSLLSLKEVVIDYKIKTNEQKLTDLDREMRIKDWHLGGGMFNPKDDACAKSPEPTA